MFWSRKCECAGLRAEVERLRGELVRVETELRAFQTEQVTMHDQVRKWMRRAGAEQRNQERDEARAAPDPATPVVSAPWGARARRAARHNGEG